MSKWFKYRAEPGDLWFGPGITVLRLENGWYEISGKQILTERANWEFNDSSVVCIVRHGKILYSSNDEFRLALFPTAC